MKSAKLLIDMCREKVGTDAELARRIGVKHHHLLEYRKGERALSPETVAALCDVLQLRGEECREWIAFAMIENPKNAGKASMLRRALFACWAAGVAAQLTINPTPAQAAVIDRLTPQAVTTLERTVYTLSRLVHTIVRWLGRARSTGVLTQPPGHAMAFA